jgi:hypothetical protein
MSEIYAVDFDGTLHNKEYPELGEPNTELFQFLIKRQQSGDKIILWTCREGDLLKEAVIYCRANGLEFDAINDNIPANKEKYKNNCRKVYADYYIDDRNKMIVARRRRKKCGKLNRTNVWNYIKKTKKSQH